MPKHLWRAETRTLDATDIKPRRIRVHVTPFGGGALTTEVTFPPGAHADDAHEDAVRDVLTRICGLRLHTVEMVDDPHSRGYRFAVEATPVEANEHER